MARLHAALLFVLCLPATAAYAVNVPGLHEAEVSVPDRSAAARQNALPAALGAVIVKVTGDRHAADQPALQPILRRAESYVQQDQYREAAQGTGAANQAQLKLWVRFDADTLDNDLRQAGLPVWDRERPSVLVWLAIDGGGGSAFVASDHQPELLATVAERARARGIALVFPLFDLQDASLQAGDLGTGDAVLAASRRYQADAILAGSVRQTAPGVWEGQWTAYIGGSPAAWSSEDDSPDDGLEEGIDGIADRLAERYARQGDAGGAVQLDITVTDVNSLDDYARTLKYLSSLSSVAAVQVTQVQTGEAAFAVSVHGGEAALDQALSFGRTLEPIPGGQGARYRLLP